MTEADPHLDHMRQALTLARRALGRTSPNPAVGAVLVRDGRVVGQGHTLPPGEPHAEVMALREAGAEARGATLYVTLEPCSHWGRTPPCTDAIVEAGVQTVYAATVDPYPQVNGAGIERLRDAGLAVYVGLCEREARQVNEGFFKRMSTGLPFVIAKYAMTLDGRIATRTGHSRWVTGEEARRNVHRLRDRVDAIVVGSGTVLADDPQLTTRLPEAEAGYGGPHSPLRVILDGSGRVPPEARILDPTPPSRTIMACTQDTPIAARRSWEGQGAEVIEVEGEGTRVSPTDLLLTLGERGVNTVLVEGGSEVLYAFFAEGLVDRVQAYVAPKLVGGQDALGPLGGTGVDTMERAWTLSNVTVQRLGDDLLIDGYVRHERLESQGWLCSAE